MICDTRWNQVDTKRQELHTLPHLQKLRVPTWKWRSQFLEIGKLWRWGKEGRLGHTEYVCRHTTKTVLNGVAILIKIEMFKLKIGLPDDPVIVFMSICPQEIESAHRDLTHVYWSAVYYSSNTESTWVSRNGCVPDAQLVYKCILFISIKGVKPGHFWKNGQDCGIVFMWSEIRLS